MKDIYRYRHVLFIVNAVSTELSSGNGCFHEFCRARQNSEDLAIAVSKSNAS